MTISDRIELLREKNGISLTHLNSAIGAYRGKLTEVRKGKASLSNAEISILAQALSTSTDYLLGNTDNPAPAGQKESPAASEGGAAMYPEWYGKLTPGELEQVRKYAEFLIAERRKDQP